jgi:hypothetical protein
MYRDRGKLYKILVGNVKGTGYSQEQSADERTKLERILNKQTGRVWTGGIRLRIVTSDGIL